MLDEKKLRIKLASLWKKHPPVTPHSFAEAETLINEVIEASTVPDEPVAKKTLRKKRSK